MLDVSLFVSQVLQVLIVALTICTVAIWAVVLKETISLFLESFGLKRTVAVATMALILLPIATVYAEDTITLIEDGNLVYYEKTKVIPNVPSGITAEQAQQLVDGVIPSVKLSAEKSGRYFGLSLTKIKTDTTVLFRNGWETEGESHVTWSVVDLVVVSSFILLGFLAVYTDAFVIIFATGAGLSFMAVLAVIFVDTEAWKGAGIIAVLHSVGCFLGWCLRRRKEKRQNAGCEHYGHA